MLKCLNNFEWNNPTSYRQHDRVKQSLEVASQFRAHQLVQPRTQQALLFLVKLPVVVGQLVHLKWNMRGVHLILVLTRIGYLQLK